MHKKSKRICFSIKSSLSSIEVPNLFVDLCDCLPSSDTAFANLSSDLEDIEVIYDTLTRHRILWWVKWFLGLVKVSSFIFCTKYGFYLLCFFSSSMNLKQMKNVFLWISASDENLKFMKYESNKDEGPSAVPLSPPPV